MNNTKTVKLPTTSGQATVKLWITVAERQHINGAAESMAFEMSGDAVVPKAETGGDLLKLQKEMDKRTIETYVTDITGVDGESIYDKYLALPEDDADVINEIINPTSIESLKKN